MSCRRALLGGCLLLLALGFVVSESLLYFPFTYLSLDTTAQTELPRRQGEITLLFVGDIMLDETARSSVRSFGADYPFIRTRHLLSEADVAIGNLEGPVTRRCTPIPGKRWSYKVHPSTVKGLKAAGFDAMVLANNHITDCGDEGIVESMAHLQEEGITPFGGGLTPEQASKPYIVKREGVTMGFLAYLAPYIYLKGKRFSYYRYAARQRKGGGAYGTRQRLRREISALRSKVDLLVVVFHVGDRYRKRLHHDHLEMLKFAVDAGASAVVCHGTHIAGPMGLYKGRPLLQGVGNFAFGSMNPFATFGLMGVFYVDTATKRIRATLGIPLYTNNLNPLVNHRPTVLKGYMARRFLGELQQRSRPFGGNFKKEGNLLWMR